MRNFTDGGANCFVDDDEVVVRIERQFRRIKRPFGLSRSPSQLVGKCTAYREKRRQTAYVPQKYPPMRVHFPLRQVSFDLHVQNPHLAREIAK
jgi:hypothetical protein